MRAKLSIYVVVALLALLASSSIASRSADTAASRSGSRSSRTNKAAIARIWHGRTRTSKADEYYEYLRDAGIKKIRAIEGNLGVQVLRRTENETTEFTVISYWESMDAIRKFAGPDVEKTHNLPKDPEYLLELEPTVKHYNVVLDEWKQRQ